MLAYAPDRRVAGAGQNSRKTLMLVVAGHAALVAVALTTKMTIDIIQRDPPIELYPVRPVKPPPDPQPPADPVPQSEPVSRIESTRPIIPVDIPLNREPVDAGPSGPSGVDVGTRLDSLPPVVVDPPRLTVKTDATLRTAEADLRPPYPVDKLRAEEEATLRLKLTIDAKGRVIAVDPIGEADPSFLAAARRHLIRSWRYKPATVDGMATATTMVISLSFRLEDA